MPADERITIRRFGPGDETAILDLFRRSFHAERSLDHFAWKFRSNPYGNEHISLAWLDSKLVAQYAAYPVRAWHQGANVPAHHIGDIMSDRAVRHIGRGESSVFAQTAKHFYEVFCEDKVAFNYGFNTATSREFSVRYTGATAVESVVYRSRGPIERLTRWQRWRRGYRLELVRQVGPEFDHFFNDVAPSYGFLVRRDATYLRWRYLQLSEPGHFIVAIRKWGRLAGWSAFRVRGDSLLWGDALFDRAHEDAAEVLLRHVAPEYPVAKIECWFPPRPSWFHATLDRLGFHITQEPNDLSLSCVPFTMRDAVSAIRASLYYTMGDSDLF
jgi:hypothetical protein